MVVKWGGAINVQGLLYGNYGNVIAAVIEEIMGRDTVFGRSCGIGGWLLAFDLLIGCLEGQIFNWMLFIGCEIWGRVLVGGVVGLLMKIYAIQRLEMFS